MKKDIINQVWLTLYGEIVCFGSFVLLSFVDKGVPLDEHTFLITFKVTILMNIIFFSVNKLTTKGTTQHGKR